MLIRRVLVATVLTFAAALLAGCGGATTPAPQPANPDAQKEKGGKKTPAGLAPPIPPLDGPMPEKKP